MKNQIIQLLRNGELKQKVLVEDLEGITPQFDPEAFREVKVEVALKSKVVST